MSSDQSHINCGDKLWSYDPVDDAWNDIVVNIDSERYGPQLLVSDNWLFLGSWIEELSGTQALSEVEPWSMWSYELSEVLLEERTLSTLFRMTNEDVQNYFGMIRVTEYPYGDVMFPPFKLNVFGFYKFVVLVRDTSMVCRVYDLSKHSWDVLPKGPDDCHLVCGKSMNLILPASTFWEHEAKLVVDAVGEDETSDRSE